MDISNAIQECFPDDHSALMDLTSFRSTSDLGLEASGVKDIPEVLEKVGRDRDGMERLHGLLRKDDQPLAMEYTGPYGDTPGYNYIGTWDCRPWANVFVLTDRDGTPSGIVPVGCGRVCEWGPFHVLRGMDCTVITDRMPYYAETVRALDSLDTDYLLVQRPFPGSCDSITDPKMQDLRHNGIDYRTYKGRFDKRWLFRFTDPVEKARLIGMMDEIDVEQRDRGHFRRSAGTVDVVSNIGHDIREVRGLLDIRSSTDRMMRRHRRLMAEDSHLLRNDDAVMGYLLISVLGARGDVLPPLNDSTV